MSGPREHRQATAAPLKGLLGKLRAGKYARRRHCFASLGTGSTSQGERAGAPNLALTCGNTSVGAAGIEPAASAV